MENVLVKPDFLHFLGSNPNYGRLAEGNILSLKLIYFDQPLAHASRSYRPALCYRRI